MSSRKKSAKAARKPGTKLGRKLIAAAKEAVGSVREISENEIHMKCWQWVCKTHPTLLIFHVANERQAAIQHHMKLKRLGVLAGVADFLAFPRDGRKVAIELKNDKNEQDANQLFFQGRWELTGGSYFLVRTLEEFQGVVAAITLFG